MDFLRFFPNEEGWKEDGGAEQIRTADLVIANDALFQLSYGPVNFVVKWYYKLKTFLPKALFSRLWPSQALGLRSFRLARRHLGPIPLSLRGGNEVRDAAIHHVSKDAYGVCGSYAGSQWIATGCALAMTIWWGNGTIRG